VTTDDSTESTRWKIHGERLIDDTRHLQLSIASVELPDGVHFEQYVLRMPKAAMMVVLNDTNDHVLMMWRHRFIINRWLWELPGGYVNPNENPATTGSPRSRRRSRLATPERETLSCFPTFSRNDGRRESAVRLARRRSHR
jgi:hypothetical protein